jgi:hypothetical protein
VAGTKEEMGDKMKFWIESEMEEGDLSPLCCKCRTLLSQPNLIFCEFELRGGGLPNIDELHPTPTGKIMCISCAKVFLM